MSDNNNNETTDDKTIDEAEEKKKQLKKCKKWVKKIEKKYDTKVICIFGEFTDYLYDMFIRQLRKVEQTRRKNSWITVIMHTTGGDADVSHKITEIMLNHKCKFCTIVPYTSGSAGAHVAMSANKLVLGKYAYLTPFDVQYNSMSLKNVVDFDLNRCVRLKDYNIVKEAIHEQQIANDQLEQMFNDRYPKLIVNNLNKLFVQHSTSHDHPLNFQTIRETGVTHVKQKKLVEWYHKIVDFYIDGELQDAEFRYDFYKSRV